jgi:nucleotide-binding universal stress UspA family protein
MSVLLKRSWIKPTSILFAAEIPADQESFAFALAQAVEYGAKFILFHAYDMLAVSAPETVSGVPYDGAAVAKAVIEHLEPLSQRARDAGVECETVVRLGLPADQILSFLREREGEQEIDRIVVGTHSLGTIGGLLVGSAAEAVLRNARTPVFFVGPEVGDASYSNFAVRTVLCGISLYKTSAVLARFAAELAAEHNARLVLHHVIQPQERAEALEGQTIDQIKEELVSLVPEELQSRIAVEPIVEPGDPTEELLYQSRAQQADLIVLGAQCATTFAAMTRHGVAHKVLAHAHCPVMTLPQTVPEPGVAKVEMVHPNEIFLAGVF